MSAVPKHEDSWKIQNLQTVHLEKLIFSKLGYFLLLFQEYNSLNLSRGCSVKKATEILECLGLLQIQYIVLKIWVTETDYWTKAVLVSVVSVPLHILFSKSASDVVERDVTWGTSLKGYVHFLED
jgi:hypothetical protein